jgi:anti-sigma B factor antagonist
MASNPGVRALEFKLETEKKESEINVRVLGRITSATSTTLVNTLRELIPQTKRVVLDLTNVDFIDSSGLGALVTMHMHARKLNCDLELTNQKPRIRDLFRVSRLDSVFEGHEELLGMTPD